jgi:hypothetical protein
MRAKKALSNPQPYLLPEGCKQGLRPLAVFAHLELGDIAHNEENLETQENLG